MLHVWSGFVLEYWNYFDDTLRLKKMHKKEITLHKHSFLFISLLGVALRLLIFKNTLIIATKV